MGFESLAKLLFLLLAIPLVILYFLKLKRPRMKIPSLYLWHQVINDNRVNSPFQRFKKHILLLLQLLLLFFLVFAAARPYFTGTSGKENLLPIIIDNSASMAAIDQTSRISRLEMAKDKIRELVRNKMEDQKIAIISFSKTATRKCDFTDNSRIILDVLEQIQPEDVPGNIEDALRMVHAMSREHSFDEVILFSDGNFNEKTSFNLPFKISYRKIGDQTPNVGIVGLNAKICGENSWVVFAEIARNDPKLAASVEFRLDGKLVATEALPMSGSDSEKISFETSGDRPSQIDVKIIPQGYDSLLSDNSASLRLPMIRPLYVYVPLTSLKAVQSSLGGMRGVRLQTIPDDQTDLIITDKESDLSLKNSCRTIFTTGFVPEQLRKFITVDGKTSELVDWNYHDALLQYAQLSELLIIGDPKLKVSTNAADDSPEKLGYDTVAFGKNGPLILKKVWAGTITYNVLFNVEKSTLPYRVAFPVIMTNLINIARVQAGLADSYAVATGILPELQMKPDTGYDIKTPDGKKFTEKTGVGGKLTGIPALKAGDYVVSEGGTVKAEIHASLLNRRETMLTGIDKIEFGELSVSAEKKAVKSPQPLWKWLAIFAFIMLLFEWWFFNKPPAGLRRAPQG